MTDYPQAVTEELERLGLVVTSALPGGPEDGETVTVAVEGWDREVQLAANMGTLATLQKWADGSRPARETLAPA